MVRGKHGSGASHRRTLQAQARIAALEAELAAEEEALAQVRVEEAVVDALSERLAVEVERRERGTADELAALQAEGEVLLSALKAEKEARERVGPQWERLIGVAVAAGGGGVEGVERMAQILGDGGYMSNSTGLSVDRATRLQVVRGDRKALVDESLSDLISRPRALLTWDLLRPELWAAWEDAGLPQEAFDLATLDPHQRAVFDRVENVADGLMTTLGHSLSVDAIHAWHPLPSVRALTFHPDADPEEGIAEAGAGEWVHELGALGTSKFVLGDERPSRVGADGEVWPIASHALAAATRDRLAATQTAASLCREWHDTLVAGEALVKVLGVHHSVLMAGPRHPRPGRAASLRHLYAKAAVGSWSRSEDPSCVVGEQPVWGRVAVGLVTAAPFWLPAGQTFSFAHSEPLTREDAAEVLLPFPQVFLSFAEPLNLAARRDPDEKEARFLGAADSAMALARGKGVEATLFDLFSGMMSDNLAGSRYLCDILDVRGARVEGVLLLADSLGRLEDTFAWCVNIPSGSAGTLGRHVIPASMSGTAHRALVENLAAVASWADWHEPDASTTVPTGSRVEDVVDLIDSAAFRRDADRTGAGGVHVLNVRSTTKDSASVESTGRQVAPHVRRGHWRRQRFGAERREVKRIRIAPVLVNAHRGRMETRVYQVPTAF